MLDSQYEIAVATGCVEGKRERHPCHESRSGERGGLAQTEATYYNICTTVLDLKLQINQAENSLALLLAETPMRYSVANWETSSCRKSLRRCPLQMLQPSRRVAQNSRWRRLLHHKCRPCRFLSFHVEWQRRLTNSAGSMIGSG